MKLRILNNSIRLRLTISETEKLQNGQSVLGETIIGPASTFFYELSPDIVSTTEVALESNRLKIRIPKEHLSNFISSEEVSLRSFVDNGSEGGLDLLIEKDFKCGPDPEGKQKDFFPNPNEKDC